MPIEITDAELSVIATDFRSLAESLINEAKNEDELQQRVKVLNEAMLDYTRQWRLTQQESLQQDSLPDCPDGWQGCPDGSCVPAGNGCGELLSAKEVVAYISQAAQGYFSSSQSIEMQARTRELLSEAAKSVQELVVISNDPIVEDQV